MKTLLKLLLLTILLPFQLQAQNPIADAIKQNSGQFRYPRSVERFYEQEGYRLIWVLKDTVKTPVWDALLLLDGVLQYGLNLKDYHFNTLSYDNLYRAQNKTATDSDKASFDVMMTDAMITLINNLHYGKHNPDFPVTRIDKEIITEFKGDRILIDALQSNDLRYVVLSAQPQTEAYINLQRHMMLLTTKFSGSNYVKPVKDIHKMAISMDRLRWINTTGKEFHLTCLVKEGVIIYYKAKTGKYLP